jgi:transcriptional regulator with XRE-family HTH domain
MSAKLATDVDKQVGARVRARRQALQVSQIALANAAGITFQQVQKYENGSNRISAGRLVQIASTLGVPISYFFEGLDGTADTSFLADPQVAELLTAFQAIDNEALRRAIVDIVLIASGTTVDAQAHSTSASSSRRQHVRSR